MNDPTVIAAEAPRSRSDPRSFDSWRINAFAPLIVVGLAILVRKSFFGFFLDGFHVWMHEFGHATTAWLTGRRALPLPIGWTNVAPDKSLFDYGGILFLLALLFIAGLRERKIWPMFLAATLAGVQAWMTWSLPDERAELCFAFSGVGGEFYLAAALMALFYVRLPEKFKWGACRYVFLFIAASSFYSTWAFWKDVKHGREGIPYGTMIAGEDSFGDMNGLHEQFGWTQREIIHTYDHLSNVCVSALVVVYVIFALRLDRFPARWLARLTED